jgi:hypothetical protein
MGYSDDWDLEELLEELFRSLKKELKSKLYTSDLFHELGPAGRMQQVETELMRYKQIKGEVETAAKLAIRMLFEDEFILPEAQVKAVEILQLFVTELDASRAHLRCQLAQYEAYLQRAKLGSDSSAFALDPEKPNEDVSEVVEMSVAKLNMSLMDMNMDSSDEKSEQFRKVKKSSLLATTRGDVTMEVF